MSQETYFCAACALWRLDRGVSPALALAGLPRDGARLGHPVCSHHRRMLNFKLIEDQITVDGYPQFHFNGTPVVDAIGLEQRDIFDQIDLIALVRGDAETGIPGLLYMLRRRLRLWQFQEWERNHIDQQPTTVLPSQQEQREEAAANERLFERIAGYLALKAAGLDTGEVAVVDDPDDQISGEELQQIRDFFEKHPHFFDNRLGEE